MGCDRTTAIEGKWRGCLITSPAPSVKSSAEAGRWGLTLLVFDSRLCICSPALPTYTIHVAKPAQANLTSSTVLQKMNGKMSVLGFFNGEQALRYVASCHQRSARRLNLICGMPRARSRTWPGKNPVDVLIVCPKYQRTLSRRSLRSYHNSLAIPLAT